MFNLSSHKACKHLWKCAIEHHTFFRLRSRPNHQRKTAQLFRLGSTFKYRGRTEYETVHKDSSRLSRRSSSTFERRPSQRYGARQSHAMNRQQRREQQIKDHVGGGGGLVKMSSGYPNTGDGQYIVHRRACHKYGRARSD